MGKGVTTLDQVEEAREDHERFRPRLVQAEFGVQGVEPGRHLGGSVVPVQAGMDRLERLAEDLHVGLQGGRRQPGGRNLGPSGTGEDQQHDQQGRTDAHGSLNRVGDGPCYPPYPC
jgi:hypothetical protein